MIFWCGSYEPGKQLVQIKTGPEEQAQNGFQAIGREI